LSSDESKSLRKRSSEEDEEWMWLWIIMLTLPFIGWRREGRWYRGGETVDG
jgi:hypothetical protein